MPSYFLQQLQRQRKRTLAVILPALFFLFFLSTPLNAGHIPAPVNRLLFKVSKLFALDEYDEAIDLIKKFRLENSRNEYVNHPELLFALGNCCLAGKDYGCAVKNYQKAVSARPDHAPSWLNMANALYNLEQYDEAARSFTKAFKLQEKKNPELLYYSGICLLLANKNAQSLKVFAGLFADFPKNIKPQWKEGMVRALIADNKNLRALPLLRELVSLYSGEKKKQWSEVLLYQYLELKMNEKARSLALTLARQYPGEEKWWKAATHAALEQGMMEEAMASLMIVSFIHPLDARDAKLLADLNLQAEIPRKALIVYEHLLEDNPSAGLLKRVVYACRSLGQQEKALDILEQYKQIVLKDQELLVSRADLLYTLSRYGPALKAYLLAAGFSRKDHQELKGRAWLMAGYCAWQIDDLQAASRAFARAARFPGQKKSAVKAEGYIKKILKIT